MQRYGTGIRIRYLGSEWAAASADEPWVEHWFRTPAETEQHAQDYINLGWYQVERIQR